MSELLHIQSSPKKDMSFSTQVADVFKKQYLQTHPGDTIKTLNLWEMTLPEVDDRFIKTHKAVIRGQNLIPSDKRFWRPIEKIILNFKNADKYLFSIPMWNYGIPYKLKHYIDIVVMEKYTYEIKKDGEFEGLLRGKPACVVYARADVYPRADDLQVTYMEKILNFIGINRIENIFIEPTSSPERGQLVNAAQNLASVTAAKF